MELDTGASASILSGETYERLWPKEKRPHLKHSSQKLNTYTGEILDVEGTIDVEVSYKTTKEDSANFGNQGKWTEPLSPHNAP